MERHFEHPRVTEIRFRGATRTTRPIIPSQRAIVEASLLRCPERCLRRAA